MSGGTHRLICARCPLHQSSLQNPRQTPLKNHDTSTQGRLLVLVDPFRHKKHKLTPSLVHTRLRHIHFAPALYRAARAFANQHLGPYPHLQGIAYCT